LYFFKNLFIYSAIQAASV